VGTHLEEKKLILEFGEKYAAYQNRVPMLIPYKWLQSKVIMFIPGCRPRSKKNA
jgi:hypothetical protein